jgi:hypothetical protein
MFFKGKANCISEKGRIHKVEEGNKNGRGIPCGKALSPLSCGPTTKSEGFDGCRTKIAAM